MLYGLLIAVYFLICAFIVLLVLLQRGKGSTGFGALGGGSQMLFGGSGGQDFLQKTTWVLGAIFMALSLWLSLMKSAQYQAFRYIKTGSEHRLPMHEEASQE
jgi:preprotein translocase subunit SecG